MSNKQFLELIDEIHMMENSRQQNIDAFTELLMAVIKAFIDQARSGRSYMPTHAKFQGSTDENGLIDRIGVTMKTPNDKCICFNITEDLNPECLYYDVIFVIQDYEQPKKDVNQYDNGSDKTSTQETFLQLPS